MITERVNAPPALQYTLCFIWLARFLISAYRLSNYLPCFRNLLNYYTARVSHVRAEEFLSKCDNSHAGGSRKPNVQIACEKCLVTVKEGIIESYTNLISVQWLRLFLFIEVFFVFLYYIFELCFQE